MASNSVTFETDETGSMPPEQDFSGNPNRPEWLPSNFETVEAFVSSYKETKGTLTKAQQELASIRGEPEGTFGQDPEDAEGTSDNTSDDPSEVGDTDKLDDAARKAAEQAGLDLAPYQSEYAETGDVSEEHRSAIADQLKGIFGDEARGVVDQFIDTKRVSHDNDMRLYMSAAGGADTYQEMVQWASKSMDAGQVAAFNNQVNSGDRATVLFAIESLKGRYEQANGKAPKLLHGRAPGHTGASPYNSSAEVTAAIKDPRYKTDPAYREEVKQRLALSNYNG